jgi:protein-S-isoprenylcysteine O-methyltransferase Ste14
MMEEIYFKAILGILFITYTVIRIAYTRSYKKIEKERKIGKRRERILVSIVGIGMMIIPITWILSGFLDSYTLALPTWIRIAGIGISIFSMWLFWWVHKFLGKNWSPVLEIMKGHSLVKTGPYKRIRHPMYTQIWLFVFSIALITLNWIVGLAAIISWSLLYFIRVPKEEDMMRKEFGMEYEKYMKETGRVIPKLW